MNSAKCLIDFSVFDCDTESESHFQQEHSLAVKFRLTVNVLTSFCL